ncbi:MAG: rRNA maturation RNase YbeY [Prevotellaceae bacterium]|nr:rRNA maturation RNase YbeY [Prevotellaceae bacterium]
MTTFHTIDCPLPQLDQAKVRQWAELVAESYGRRLGDVAYVFVSEEEILRLNRQYLGHDYLTDIITFDYCEGPLLSGDLFISPATVLSNAQTLGESPERELHRVLIHGILHLCGLKDKAPGERKLMEQAEDKALKLLESL